MSNAIHPGLAAPSADGSSEKQLRRALEELEEAEKTRKVLQETVDALSEMADLDQFLAVALRIVARAFRSTTCSYFEHRGGDPIQLKYAYLDGQVLSVGDVLALGEEFALLKQMTVGFTVPDVYFGEPFRTRTRSSLIDHSKTAPPTEMSKFSCSIGRPIELNVPLLVGGRPEGALVIRRGYGDYFNATEVSLAERLAEQLAMAMVVSRLATEAKIASIAREQEFAANVRAEEVEEASRALQNVVDALASMPNLEEFIPAALHITARAFKSNNCSYFEHRGDDPIRLVHWFLGDKVLSREDILGAFGQDPGYVEALFQGFTIDDSYFGIPLRARKRASVVDHADPERTSIMDFYCRKQGWQLELNIPLLVAGRAEGALVIKRGSGEPFSAAEISLGERLAQHLALAVEVSRLSNEAKEASIAREKEAAAKIQVDEVEKASQALQMIVDALGSMPDLDQFVPAALRIAAHAFNSDNCSYFEHRGDDPIRIAHWFLGDKVLSHEEVLTAYGQEPEFVEAMLNGFTVDDSYFGRPFRSRTRASIVDHGDLARTSFIDLYCRKRNWSLELNVPLVVADKPIGELVIERGSELPYSVAEISLAERLGQHLALAMEVSRLAAEAKQAAFAREQETAAKVRAVEGEKASYALREMVDALAAIADLDYFIPAALQIVARAFNSKHASYFENRGNDPIRLMYWFLDDRVLSREDVFNLSPRYDFMKWLATGFTVEDSYFGCPFRERIRASVINHDDEGRASVIDLNCRLNNWCLELNVPLVVAGHTVGALVIQRGAGESYSDAEVTLGERLGQQLAIAMEVSRLSAETKAIAIMREREIAAQGRADEMANHSEALRRTLDSLVDESGLSRFTEKVLTITSEQLQAPVVEYWSVDIDSIVRLELTCRDGVIYEGSDIDNDVRTRGLKVPPYIINAPTVGEMTTYLLCDDLADNLVQQSLYDGLDFSVKHWCEERGVERMLNLPLLRGGRCFAALLAYLPHDKKFDQPKIDVAYSFAQQLGLSIRLRELAEESKHAAVSQEREVATQLRAAEFAKANAVLSSTLDRLAEERDLHTFPRAILKEAISQTGGQDGIILLYEAGTDLLRTTELVLSGTSVEDDGDTVSVPFWTEFEEDWKAAMESTGFQVVDIEMFADKFPLATREWHRSRGHKYLVSVPMVLRSQPFGYFGVAFSKPADEVSKISLGLIQALAQQTTLAIQLTRLAESSKQSALSMERQQVIIQEREHMSREIHDRLTQGYAAILMQQHAMRRTMKSNPETMHKHLDIIERLSKDNLAEARKTMDELRLDPLGPTDLRCALKACIGQFDGRYPMEISLDIQDELPPIPHYLEMEVCRVVGEAITNACKHSRANSVHAKVQYRNQRLSILIRDEGIGFDAQVKATSFGIASMHERAARAGAELTITSSPGSGTQIWLTMGTL